LIVAQALKSASNLLDWFDQVAGHRRLPFDINTVRGAAEDVKQRRTTIRTKCGAALLDRFAVLL